MANAAIKNGIEILGITEHGPNMLGSCKEFYFKSLRFIERDAFPPLKLMLGAELNIMDFKGSVDLSQAIMETSADGEYLHGDRERGKNRGNRPGGGPVCDSSALDHGDGHP